MEQNKVGADFLKTLPWRIASNKWLDCFYHINGKDENRELKIFALNDGHHPSKDHRNRIRDNANAIVTAVNSTYGAGINPEAVKDIRDTLKAILNIQLNGGDLSDLQHCDLLQKAKAALEKATIKS